MCQNSWFCVQVPIIAYVIFDANNKRTEKAMRKLKNKCDEMVHKETRATKYGNFDREPDVPRQKNRLVRRVRPSSRVFYIPDLGQ